MGKNFFKKSSLIIVMILAVVLTLIPKTVVLANNDNASNLTIEYRAHVQDIGWMDFVKSGVAGTTGQAKRLEALEIKAQLPEGVELSARAHVQDIGWQEWKTANDVTVGTEGQFKRLEALQIAVKGLEGYEVKYRAHVENIGWQDWVTASTDSDNNTLNVFAGTTGQSKRLEALEIVVTKIEAAEKALRDAKNNAIEEIVDYINELVPQCQKNAEALEKELTKALDAIENATTTEEVTSAVETAKAIMDAIETDAEIAERETAEKALAEAKSDAINQWQEKWIEKANSGIFDFESLETLLNKWCDTIGESETLEAVQQALSDAQAELATFKSEEEILAEAKKEGTTTVQSTYDNIKSESKINDEDNKNTPLQKSLKEKIDIAKDEATKAIENATTPEEVEVAVTSAETKMQGAKAVFDMQKAGSDEIQNYWYNLDKQYPDKLQEFGPIISDAIDKINNATTPEEVAGAVKEAKESMDKVVLPEIKKECQSEMSKVIDEAYPAYEKDGYICSDIDLDVLDMEEEYDDKINNAETIEEAEKLKQEFLDWLDKYIEENYSR